jgi:hypothetical protein
LGQPDVTLMTIFKESTLVQKFAFLSNIFLIGMGIYILGPGLYASVDSIVLSYQSHLYGSPFTCASVGI